MLVVHAIWLCLSKWLSKKQDKFHDKLPKAACQIKQRQPRAYFLEGLEQALSQYLQQFKDKSKVWHPTYSKREYFYNETLSRPT